MNFYHNIGRLLIFVGAVILALGVIFLLLGRFGFNQGASWRLPGDIYIKKDNFIFYFPLTTSIILSIILTLIFRFLKK